MQLKHLFLGLGASVLDFFTRRILSISQPTMHAPQSNASSKPQHQACSACSSHIAITSNVRSTNTSSSSWARLCGHALALVINIHTQEAHPGLLRILDSDSTLTTLPCMTSLTVNVLPIYNGYVQLRTERLLDVSNAFVQEIPMLASRLTQKEALRVLQSPRLSQT
ncbi:hypothetical protein K438DRAFT_1970794 [Mycena galopus ATCC 62051]|nr:hypothetical protein K438DRAFT_1970794 [Mycena galopus ATCC 62051]